MFENVFYVAIEKPQELVVLGWDLMDVVHDVAVPMFMHHSDGRDFDKRREGRECV